MPTTAFLLSSTLLVACWLPQKAGLRMQAEIKDLKTELADANQGLSDQRAKLEEQMQRAERKIEEVARTLDSLNLVARKTDADFGVQLDRVVKEAQELRGLLELSDYRVGEIEKVIIGENSLASRVQELEKIKNDVPPPVADSQPAKNPPPSGSSPKPAKTDSSPEALLQQGNRLAKAGKHDDARGVFRQVINRWPKKPTITDQAYFRLGDIYYYQKEYRRALPEFIQVVEKFPKGLYVDDAYYRIGLCSMHLGALADARVFFRQIVLNHKKSPLYGPAKKKLVEIDKRLSAAKKK